MPLTPPPSFFVSAVNLPELRAFEIEAGRHALALLVTASNKNSNVSVTSINTFTWS